MAFGSDELAMTTRSALSTRVGAGVFEASISDIGRQRGERAVALLMCMHESVWQVSVDGIELVECATHSGDVEERTSDAE